MCGFRSISGWEGGESTPTKKCYVRTRYWICPDPGIYSIENFRPPEAPRPAPRSYGGAMQPSPKCASDTLWQCKADHDNNHRTESPASNLGQRSDVLTPCAARYRLQVGNFLLGRAILALHNSLPYLMMGNLIRAEIRGCGDLNNRLGSETPRLRRELSTFPGYPKLGHNPKLGSSRIVRVPEI